MHELPSVPGNQSSEQVAIGELNQKIDVLTEEIDKLSLRLNQEMGSAENLSGGDNLPDKESAVLGKRDGPSGRRRIANKDSVVTGKALELLISEKMQERVKYIFERDILQKKMDDAT